MKRTIQKVSPLFLGFLIYPVSILSDSLNQSPIELQSNNIQFDAKKNILKLKGDVFAKQKNSLYERTLKCAELIYNKDEGIIYAIGTDDMPVYFKNESGDVLITSHMTLSDDFESGKINNLTLKRVNNSTLRSGEMQRVNDHSTVLHSAEYTACTFCRNTKPLWQLKSNEVVHDEETQDLVYYHATLEFKGVPVFYMPYFSHPDPSVTRKSGLLIPSLGKNTNLGYVVSVPVYYVVDGQQDLTLTPGFTTKQSGVLMGEYRYRFMNGSFITSFSYTNSKDLKKNKSDKININKNEPQLPTQHRWNLSIRSEKDLSDTQRILFDINRASDTTYLQRYALVQQTPFMRSNTNLRSTIIWQRFTELSYMDVKTQAFQTDAQQTTPYVLPKATFHYQDSMPGVGGVIIYEGSLLNLFRQKQVIGRAGTRMYRLSGGMKWKRPFVLPVGQLLTVQLHARTDLYMLKKYFDKLETYTEDRRRQMHNHVRFFPQGSLDWQWPLMKTTSNVSYLLTPRLMLVSSPLTVNNRHIPNEDSQTIELDDLSLFLANRFQGIDRVDAGFRFVGGLDSEVQFSQNRSIGLFFGQSRRLDKQNTLGTGRGEDSKTSDLVAHLKIKPFKLLKTRHRFSYNPHLKVFRFSENGVVFGNKAFKISLGHVFLNRMLSNSRQMVSQVNSQVSVQITKRWGVSVGQIRNLKKYETGAALATFLTATYDDECFTLDLGIYKSSQYDRDIKPETAVLLRFNFKTLSSITLSASPIYTPGPLTRGLE